MNIDSISLHTPGPDGLAGLAAFPPATGTIVGQLGFGGLAFLEPARARMKGLDWPLLWAQGDVCPGTGVAGVQAYRVAGPEVRRINVDGRVVGSAWSDPDADFCLLAGILPADPGASRFDQTRGCFEQIEAALGQAGLDFSHVARTWLYLDQLLDWYDEFNAARTEFFHSRNVFQGLIPASTGIGARNPAGAALVAGALAVRPRHDRVTVREVGSPLQRAATEYRSSFSRAVEVAVPGRRTRFISGTASIAPDGRTLHGEDVGRQIELTLDVVEGILESRGMDWPDTTRAIAYFHDLEALPRFEACCRARGLPALPVVPVQATVCRGDLLFELELDAASASAAPDPA